jgi:hypothetical protein
MTYAHLEGWWTEGGNLDSLLRAGKLVAETRRGVSLEAARGVTPGVLTQ